VRGMRGDAREGDLSAELDPKKKGACAGKQSHGDRTRAE
jgi:hypothetical protein